MKFIYVLRVVVISFEMLWLMGVGLIWVYFHEKLNCFAASGVFNQDAIKYLMLAPVCMAIWVVNDCRLLLLDEKDTTRLLTLWSDYWRLKAHVWVTLFFALVFTGLSFFPWVVMSGIGSGFGLLLFLASIGGQFIVAASIYNAKIRVKELIVHANF